MRKLVQKFLNLFGYELRRLSRRHGTPLSAEWFGNFYYFVRMYQQIRNVEGDIVECGVGRGRTFLYLSFLLSTDSKKRTLWGFDSFKGFPKPTQEDKSPRHTTEGDRWTDTSEQRILWLLRDAGISSDTMNRIRLVPGFYEKTLANHDVKKIAFLHLDVDLYRSYKVCLEKLYPFVQPGGVVLFDEYDDPMFPGGKKAIDEYFRGKNSTVQKDASSGKYYLIKP